MLQKDQEAICNLARQVLFACGLPPVEHVCAKPILQSAECRLQVLVLDAPTPLHSNQSIQQTMQLVKRLKGFSHLGLQGFVGIQIEGFCLAYSPDIQV